MSGSSTQLVYRPSQFDEYNLAFSGNSVACILAGIYVAIAGTNLYMLLLQKNKYRILLLYSIIQLALTTLYVILARLYNTPGRNLAIFHITDTTGPTTLSPWRDVVEDASFVLNTWISDAFLLYRCYAIYMGNNYAIAFPMFLYLATVCSSLAFLIVSSIPGAVYTTHAVRTTAICYWSLSAATNICASYLICARLQVYRKEIAETFGSQRGAFYLGYIALTLEAALLYTVSAIVVVVVFTLNTPVEFVFIPVLGMIQTISPSLIIYRIARGISFEAGVHGPGSIAIGSVHFATGQLPEESDSRVIE